MNNDARKTRSKFSATTKTDNSEVGGKIKKKKKKSTTAAFYREAAVYCQHREP